MRSFRVLSIGSMNMLSPNKMELITYVYRFIDCSICRNMVLLLDVFKRLFLCSLSFMIVNFSNKCKKDNSLWYYFEWYLHPLWVEQRGKIPFQIYTLLLYLSCNNKLSISTLSSIVYSIWKCLMSSFPIIWTLSLHRIQCWAKRSM